MTLCFGWWPFNFLSANQIAWDTAIGGARFDGHGVMISAGPLRFAGGAHAGAEAGAMSLELWLTPAEVPTNRLPSVAAFYELGGDDQLLVGQWKDALILRRCPLFSRDTSTFHEVGIGDLMSPGRTLLITLASSPERGTAIYTNGVFYQKATGYSLRSGGSNWFPSLSVGDSAVGGSPWKGNVHGIAVYSSILDAPLVERHYDAWISGRDELFDSRDVCLARYRFEATTNRQIANLVVPGHPLILPKLFRSIIRPFLVPVWKDYHPDINYLMDVSINLLGFIPMGLCAALVFVNFPGMSRGNGSNQPKPRSSPVTGVLGGAFFCVVFSFAIEWGQVFLPSRASQMSDLILNAMGGLVGAFMAVLVLSGRLNRMPILGSFLHLSRPVDSRADSSDSDPDRREAR